MPISIKRFKTISSDGMSLQTYDLGANATNVVYKEENQEQGQEEINVKLAIDDLYSKIGEESGSSIDLNKIGFSSILPSTGEEGAKILDRQADSNYKNVSEIRAVLQGGLPSDGILIRIIKQPTIVTDMIDYTNCKSVPGRTIRIWFEEYKNNTWIKNNEGILSTEDPILGDYHACITIKAGISLHRIKRNTNKEIILSSWTAPLVLNTTLTTEKFSFNTTTSAYPFIFQSNGYEIDKIGLLLSNDLITINNDSIKKERNLSQSNMSFLDLIYPIGSIYMSMNSIHPNYLFGGTWEEIKGRFLLSQGVYDLKQYIPYGAGDIGGREDSVLLKHNHNVKATSTNASADSNGSHSHSMGDDWYKDAKGSKSAFKGSGSTYNRKTRNTTSAGAHTHIVKAANIVKTFTIENVDTDHVVGKVAGTLGTPGIGNNIGNLPPYLVVHMWQRTA